MPLRPPALALIACTACLTCFLAAQGPPAGPDHKGAQWANQDLRQKKLQGANLYGANLEGANLEGVNLEGADLRTANLKYTKFMKVILRKADLRQANLYYTRFEQADLSGANLEGHTAFDASYIKSLRGAILRGAKVVGSIADTDLQ